MQDSVAFSQKQPTLVLPASGSPSKQPEITDHHDDDDDDVDMEESPTTTREGGGTGADNADDDDDDDVEDLNEETQQLEEQQEEQESEVEENNDDGSDSSAHQDDDDDAKEEKSQQQQQKSENNVVNNKKAAAPVILGGSIEKAAFCLLQGFMENPDNKKKAAPKKIPVLVPINRLPAMLGRSHNTTDKSFFGLGKNIKAVSRVQFCIDYRIPSGGKIGQYNASKTAAAADGTTTSSNEFIYQPNNNNKQENNKDEEKKPEQDVILNPTNAVQDEAGFYAITCIGKNPIRVNGLKVDQDQTCLLTHGSDIKISAFCLYFLLPSKPSTKTMQVTVVVDDDGKDQRKQGGNEGDDSSEIVAAASKKRKAPEMMLYSSASAATMAIPKVAVAVAKRRRGANQGLQDDLDNMTTDELLHEIDVAVEKGTWDRRCGFMGSTVLYRAVREAAHARHVQENAGRNGISKAQIVGWIHSSDKFGKSCQFMQSKLEKKSYQCSITRAMQRAGYSRCSEKSFGRQVRWHLPANVERKYVPREETAAGGQEKDAAAAAAAAGDDDDDNDNDDDDISADASQDGASQEDKVADGNEKDSDDDNDDDDDDDNGVEGADGASPGAWKLIKAEIDALSTERLLEEFHQAVENDRWDRRCQFVASTIGFRAVTEAARAADFRQCAEPDGVSRAQVVSWINESARFGKWGLYMADKLKPRSYQSNIVKSMQLAGYHRSSVKTFGCNIRWFLPDVPVDENVDDDDDDDDNVDNDDDDDNGTSGGDAQSQGSTADVKQEDSDNDDSGSDDE